MTPLMQRSGSTLDSDNPFVRKLARLATLSAADRIALETASSAVRLVEQGTSLSGAAVGPKGWFLILEGYACHFMQRKDGSRQITGYLVPGDHCASDTPLSVAHQIATLSACKVAFVAGSTFQAMQESSSVREALQLSSLIEDATLREWLMSIGRRTAEERLAHLFCELLTRLRAVGLVDRGSFRFPLTQFDLGDTMGLSYVHVNRTLQALRQQQLITLRGRILTILDVMRLEAVGEFKPGYLGRLNA